MLSVRSFVGTLLLSFVLGACPGTATSGDVDQDLGLQDISDASDDSSPGDSSDPDTSTPPDVWLASCEDPVEGPETGTCKIESGDSNLLLRGHVLTPTGLQSNAAVLVVNGWITCVGCDCLLEPEAATATKVSCPDGLISPGLINAHDHIGWSHVAPIDHGTDRYDHRHEWRKGKNGKKKLSVGQSGNQSQKKWGELRQVIAGTTSYFGSGGTEGLVRNLDLSSRLEGLDHNDAEYSTFPLGDSGGSLYSSGCDGYSFDDPDKAAASAAYVPHIAEGIVAAAQNEFACVTGDVPGGVDLLIDNAAFIHGIGLKTSDIALLASNGTGLVWSPRSNTDLYGMTADAPLYRRLGAMIALGSDWTPSGSMNMLRELKCAETWNNAYWNRFFTDAELVAMATVNAAELLGFGDVIGSLVPGKAADISIWNAKNHTGYRAILDAGMADVVLVLRGGKVLYGDDSLVTGLSAGPECDDLEVCGSMKRVCLAGEIGMTMPQIAADLASDYPLFFCGKPEGEPSCIPLRPGEFTGAPTQTDSDGDGIPNASDNCPNVFNPLRPVDDMKQMDADGDLVGDVCDPCPFDADTVNCTSIDPEDLDGDGVKIPQDNCPNQPNPNQEDGDGDGAGDICDDCPDYPNPGGMPCPATVYAVKKGEVQEGKAVSIPEVIVTAIEAKGLVGQVDPGSAEYEGIEYSGIFVYLPDGVGPEVQVGSRVTLSGEVSDFYGQRQIFGSTYSVLEGEPVLIEPLSVLPNDVVEGGPQAQALEAVLVEVKDVTVTTVSPAGQEGEVVENEFEVTGGLPVDDRWYVISPMPTVGQVLPRVTGVLLHSWSRKKLMPRNAQDLNLGPPSVVGVDAGVGAVYAGQTSTLVTVSLSHATDDPVIVSFSSSAPEVLEVDASVSIPAGQTTAMVGVTGVSAGTADVTASLNGTEKSASLTVLAADFIPSLVSLTPAEKVVSLNKTAELVLTIDYPAPTGGVAVTLSAEGVSASVPETVLIEEGALSASVTVSELTEIGLVTISATLGDITLSSKLDVQDVNYYGLLLVEVYYDNSGSDDGLEWIKLYNGTPGTVDLSEYAIGYGGGDYAWGTHALDGVLNAGECALVGGPTSNAGNGMPAYTSSKDFSPDIQNSGSDADGIALFKLDEADITAGSVPLDAVVYGGSNSAGLLGPDGAAVAEPHVGDAPSGSSIVRTSLTTWDINPTPNSGGCIVIQ